MLNLPDLHSLGQPGGSHRQVGRGSHRQAGRQGVTKTGRQGVTQAGRRADREFTLACRQPGGSNR